MRSICPHEHAIVHAVRTRQWEDFLLNHVKVCETCRDVVTVAAWASNLPEAALENRPLPDPGIVWFKARLRNDQIAEEKAVRHLILLRSATWLAGAGWLAVNWPNIWGTIKEVKAEVRAAGSELAAPFASLSLSSLSAGLVALGLALACLACFWPIFHSSSE